MDARYLNYTKKDIQRLIEYYLGTPRIYNYCYENSKEFREFVDNANEEMKAAIKKMHRAHYISRCQEPLAHIGTFGLSLIGKKLAENKELKRLEETIKGEEFKTFFKNFNDVVLLSEINK